MTLVKNSLSHPYTPTAGNVIEPQGIADVDLTHSQELDAVASGALLVLDPDYVPADPAVPPLAGRWQLPVGTTDDLPVNGNQRGDVRLIMDDADVTGGALRYWDGDSWELLAGGGGGTPVEPDTINITALLTGVEVGDPVVWNDGADRFEPGELVPE